MSLATKINTLRADMQSLLLVGGDNLDLQLAYARRVKAGAQTVITDLKRRKRKAAKEANKR